MKNTDFAYAVTSIRAKEAELLKPEFTEQLISAPDFSAAKRMLTDRGFKEFEKTDDASAALVGCMSDVWNFIKDVAPDIAQLYFLIVKNDFHNLKAVLKSAVFDGADPEEYYIYPCIYGPAELFEHVKNKKFDYLPSFLREPAAKGYEILTSTLDGQLLDVYLDRCSLEETLRFAKGSGCDLAVRLAEVSAAISDAKISLRSSKASKTESFIRSALCECDLIDAASLAREASKGTEEALRYLEGTPIAPLCPAYKISDTAFERAGDDMLTDILDKARLVSFGPEPLIAYYCAKETEIKNLRIIMSCKHIGLGADKIKERMRTLYV